MTYEPESLLKGSYKKFKNRSYTLDDLKEFNKFSDIIEIKSNECKLINPEYFKPKITAHEIGKGSGFFYIPNPFRHEILLRLIVESLTKWPIETNRMNIDIESDRPNDVWNTTLDELNSGKKLSECWLFKLRWTSLGYHYQWTERVYKPEYRSEVPLNLSEVMKDIISLLNWDEFIPEAAIVNYYHINSAMCFHQDHAEIAKNVPLVSISISQPGVYLLGTSDPADEPRPITLYHGDVVVMSGSSRLAYHAVPKIFKLTSELLCSKLLDTVDCNEEDVHQALTTITNNPKHADTIWEYLQLSRININMRQVLNAGQAFPA